MLLDDAVGDRQTQPRSFTRFLGREEWFEYFCSDVVWDTFINRFFTNRATSQTENTLLILIRPEIIIQQENEDILFPGLSDQLGSASSYLR